MDDVGTFLTIVVVTLLFIFIGGGALIINQVDKYNEKSDLECAKIVKEIIKTNDIDFVLQHMECYKMFETYAKKQGKSALQLLVPELDMQTMDRR